jgi:serine/threonine protein kinase
LPLTAEGRLLPGAKPWPFIRERFNQRNGRFSPDTRWLVYESDESGQFEVYIRSFPITEVDGKAAPKTIDFGVAKALAQKLTVDTILTRVGTLIGTPEYMSPEQAVSSGEDIDTRTDVYSLGIILYELLAGVPPLELHQATFEEFLRRLRAEEPAKLSTKIRTQDPAMSTAVALKRRTVPLTPAKQMRGDLDAIVLKALRERKKGAPWLGYWLVKRSERPLLGEN